MALAQKERRGWGGGEDGREGRDLFRSEKSSHENLNRSHNVSETPEQTDMGIIFKLKGLGLNKFSFGFLTNMHTDTYMFMYTHVNIKTNVLLLFILEIFDLLRFVFFFFLWTNKKQVWIQNRFIVRAWRQRTFLAAAITHSAVWNPVQVLPEHLSIFPNTEQRWLVCLLKDAIGCDLAVRQRYRRTQRHKAVNAEHWSILFRTSPLLSLFSLAPSRLAC